MKTREITLDDVALMLSNPFYCVTVDPVFCVEHEYLVSEDLWIKAWVESIKQDWAENFLKNLLRNLKWEYVTFIEEWKTR